MLHFLKIFIVLVVLVFSTTNSNAQILSGTVVDGASMETIPSTHVINKRTFKGTLTDINGKFKLQIEWGDTVVFSNISFKYLYFVYNDSSTALTDVIIQMEEQNYLLNEVSIFSYKLTTNEDKAMVIKPPRIPPNSEMRELREVNAGIYNPVDFLYNLFGSKPQQLRKLAELKAEEAYRYKLETSNNRQNVTKITGLSREELEAFMFYCKFAPVQMNTMNDYEFLISVIHCYNQYVKERELEDFLQQFD